MVEHADMSYQLQVKPNDTINSVSKKAFLKLPGVKAGKVAHRQSDGYCEQWFELAGYTNWILQSHKDDLFAVNVWGAPGERLIKALATSVESVGGELYDEETTIKLIRIKGRKRK